jgi:hypothetical protein
MGVSLVLEVQGAAEGPRAGVRAAAAALDDGRAAGLLERMRRHFASRT